MCMAEYSTMQIFKNFKKLCDQKIEAIGYDLEKNY